MPDIVPSSRTRPQSLDRPCVVQRTPGKVDDNYLFTQSSVLSPKSSQIPQSSKYRLASAFLCLCLLAWSSPALAHRVLVFAFAEGTMIHTESKFVGSGPVQKGEVQVQDKKTGQVILTGTTNDQGKFSFKIPSEAVAGRLDLLIVVGASMGHQGEWLLKADSYLPGAQEMTTAAAPVTAAQTMPSPTAATPGAKAAALDQQALEEALNKTLERQLAPIREMLMELTVRRRTLPEIIGGLGYIAGIFGVVAYFMSKKQPKP
jgi:nickel transport protein